jgi:transcriptional regulator with XRE-family HTH domain
METENSSCQTGNASSSTTSVREQLLESLKTSKEYRHSFVEEKIRTGLAAQIKAIREKHDGGLTQKRFAEILGKAQSWVARLEDPNAKPATLSTLLQVAYALDVDLQVRFAPFSELLNWVSGIPHWTPGLSPESLAVEDFEHDSGLNAETLKPSEGATAELSALCDAIGSELLAEGQTEDINAELGRGKTIGAAAAGQDLEEKQRSGRLVLMRIGLNQGAAAAQGKLEQEAA